MDNKRLEKLIEAVCREVIAEHFHSPRNKVLEIKPDDKKGLKARYGKQAWDIIQDAYSYIGGCKSFNSVRDDGGFNDFLNGQYYWRIKFAQDGKTIEAIKVYKHTPYGMKSICSASNNNKEAYNNLINYETVRNDRHFYGEVSGKSEHNLRKNPRIKWVNKENVPGLLPGKLVTFSRDETADAESRDPYDEKTHYYRPLKGQQHRKAMYGNPMIKK